MEKEEYKVKKKKMKEKKKKKKREKKKKKTPRQGLCIQSTTQSVNTLTFTSK